MKTFFRDLGIVVIGIFLLFVFSLATQPTEDTKNVSTQNTGTASLFDTCTTYSNVDTIVDGDTIDVSNTQGTSTIRLIGVDAPEYNTCGFREATEYLRATIKDNEICVVGDPTQDTTDTYGRTLGYVFLSDGTLLNEALIAGGYAREYTHITPYQKQSDFRAAEVAAQNADRHLWNADFCE